MSEFSIHPDTKVGPVWLKVSNLERSLAFYRDVIGLQSSGGVLSADGEHPLLILEEDPEAVRKPRGTTGLYHFAILLPDRPSLAASLNHLATAKTSLQGLSDHWVSEAIYLPDADGNGIEIYADRPGRKWTDEDGNLHEVTAPMDVDDLMSNLPAEEWRGMPADTKMGHVHLHVASVPEAEAFYHGLLGFDISLKIDPTFSMVSAGGYHHHIGLNTWAGEGAPPPPEHAVGLKQFAIQVPNRAAFEAVRARIIEKGVQFEGTPEGMHLQDPSKNHLVIVSA